MAREDRLLHDLARQEQTTHDRVMAAACAHFLATTFPDSFPGKRTSPTGGESSLPPEATSTHSTALTMNPTALTHLADYLRSTSPFKDDSTLVEAVITYASRKENDPRYEFTHFQYFQPPATSINVYMPFEKVLQAVATILLDETEPKLFPGSSAKDKLERMLALFNRLNELRHMPALCAVGIRHELLSALNGVMLPTRTKPLFFPQSGPIFIADIVQTQIDAFMKQLQAKTYPLFAQYMLDWKTAEPDAALWADLFQYLTTEEAITTRKEQLLAHGVNPEEALIKQTLLNYTHRDYLPYRNPPLGGDLFWENVYAIFESTHTTRTPRWQKIRTIIQGISCKAEQDVLLPLIQDHSKIEETYARLTQYEPLLPAWDDKLIPDIDAFFALVHAHDENPTPLTEAQEALIITCKNHIERYEADWEMPKIRSYFANIFAAEWDKQGHYIRDLRSEPFQKKFKATDEWLRSVFPPEMTDDILPAAGTAIPEIEITPYLVNRVFMTALAYPFESWTPVFSRVFFTICAHVENEVGTAADQHAPNHALKKDSYPPTLLERLSCIGAARKLHEIGERIDLPPDDFVHYLGWINALPEHSQMHIRIFFAALETAIKDGDILRTNILLEAYRVSGLLKIFASHTNPYPSLLMKAYESHQFEIIGLILTACTPEERISMLKIADENVRDAGSFLMKICSSKDLPLFKTVLAAYPDDASKLKVLNKPNATQETALMLATELGYIREFSDMLTDHPRTLVETTRINIARYRTALLEQYPERSADLQTLTDMLTIDPSVTEITLTDAQKTGIQTFNVSLQ